MRDGDWRVAPAPADLARPPRRDHRPGRPQDDDQRAQLRREGLHGRLRGRELARPGRTCVDGQLNLRGRRRADDRRSTPARRQYRARTTRPATLVVRPRGWHLRRAARRRSTATPISAQRCSTSASTSSTTRSGCSRAAAGRTSTCPRWRATSRRGCGTTSSPAPQDALGIPRGTIRATVLIETILAAFEMDEILYELRDHAAGLNAGRWDYIFSVIKKLPRTGRSCVLPDRAAVTMTVPFMRAYTELLVKTCHRRGRARDRRHGGVHPQPPRRRGQRASRSRRCARTRSARPATASTAPGWRTPTWSRSRARCSTPCSATGRTRSTGSATTSHVAAAELLDVAATPGEVTEDGPAQQRQRRLQYLEAWLRGTGAVAIYNLMEDAATAEISRSQVWQWIHHGVRRPAADVLRITDEEMTKLGSGYDEARGILESIATRPDYVEFLTLPAYEQLMADETGQRRDDGASGCDPVADADTFLTRSARSHRPRGRAQPRARAARTAPRRAAPLRVRSHVRGRGRRGSVVGRLLRTPPHGVVLSRFESLEAVGSGRRDGARHHPAYPERSGRTMSSRGSRRVVEADGAEARIVTERVHAAAAVHDVPTAPGRMREARPADIPIVSIGSRHSPTRRSGGTARRGRRGDLPPPGGRPRRCLALSDDGGPARSQRTAPRRRPAPGSAPSTPAGAPRARIRDPLVAELTADRLAAGSRSASCSPTLRIRPRTRSTPDRLRAGGRWDQWAFGPIERRHPPSSCEIGEERQPPTKEPRQMPLKTPEEVHREPACVQFAPTSGGERVGLDRTTAR